MKLIVGIDIGNATTESTLAEVDEENIKVQGYGGNLLSPNKFNIANITPSQLRALPNHLDYQQKNGAAFLLAEVLLRSEERRVGKECRSRWSPYH